MRVQLSIWDRLTRVVVFLLFLAAVLAVALWYYPVMKHTERLRQENLRLDAEIEREALRQRELQHSLHLLQHDPRTIERLAREKLGYARPGETVIRFEAPRTNAGGVRP